MEIINHFGHEHSLAFYEEKNEEQIKPYLCKICTLPILSSPSYTCTKSTCEFFLHKSCAKLPDELYHPRHFHRGGHTSPLRLRDEPSHDDPNCQNCRKLCHNFTYTCSICRFNLHPTCGTPVETKIKHKSHNEHPLVAIYNEFLGRCDACGEKHEGFFFSCQECNFWIHQDCTLLPNIVKLVCHDHFLMLTYSLAEYQRGFCGVCDKKFYCKGLYFCGQCRYTAHLNCAKLNMEKLTSETGQENLIIHLPDEGNTFPSSTIRILSDDINGNKKKLTIDKFHNHPLIFHEDTKTDHDHDQELVCNACIQPIISSPFWRCDQSNCNFLIHNICANLPRTILHGNFFYGSVLWPNSSKHFFNSVFSCFFCRLPCNGSGYRSYDDNTDIFIVDLACASAPNTIMHASHGHDHVLFLTDYRNTTIPFTCCSNQSRVSIVYRCVTCSFTIHLWCALLPKNVSHKFDKHPLELIFNIDQKLECCFCEFCEEDIDQRYWFYHCHECDQSLHIKCVPSLGYLSKIKFGGTINVSCHPDHRMALTRMLMEGNQRCGFCKEIIKGFVDDMAFYCSLCEFWIHFKCARECWSNRTSEESSRLWYEPLFNF